MTAKWLPPLRLSAQAGEHALSYLVRWGARNGEESAARFAADIGVSLDGVRTGREVRALELAARLPSGSLREWTPQVDARSRTLRIGAETVRLQDWDGSARRWCPACHAADRRAAGASSCSQPGTAPYHRAIWDLVPVDRCPEHGVALRSRCPTCGSGQDWTHAPLDVCACGTRLSSEKFSDAVADALSDFVAARVCGVGAGEGPPLLRGLSLDRCVPLLERLGLAASCDPGTRWVSVRALGRLRCMRLGFDVALSWPRGFLDALDRIVSARCDDARARGGMTLSYGWIHEHWINPLPPDGIGAELKSALLSHATANGIVPEGEAILGRRMSEASMTLAEATRRLGMGHDRARRLLAARRALPTGHRRSVGMPIDRREVERLREDRARRLHAVAARGRLGVGRKTFRMLVGAGLVARHEDGHGNERFLADDVARLLETLRGGVPSVDAPPVGCLSLAEASRSFGMPIAELVRRIAAAELRVVGTMASATALAGIVVRASELGGSRRTSRDGLTLQEAAGKLGLHPEAVLHLARTELLPGQREGRSWRFPDAGVQAFDAAHVSGARVAALLGTSPRSAIAKLATLDVRPVTGPPECRQAIFRREPAEAAVRLL